jgi:hypothetical protein
MRREEEIKKYAEEKCMLYNNIGFDGDIYSLITETINWADENPKEGLVSIDKVCKYLESLVYQEFAGAPLERVFDEYAIKQFREVMEE